ncbi:MAG: inositol monophosphatase family protein [Agrobacterium albertimagni]|jgi:histidinol phosphatase-like enzyme (inositol monophosphatase family)
MTRSLDADLAFAARLADAAWAAIRVHFRNLARVEDKGPSSSRSGIDPVTEADRAAERAMRALVAAERPEDGITGEEYPDTSSASGWRWYFDPIDGTRAFVAGLPVWTTLIALADPEGVPVIGLIDQPVLGERYLGWPGGARLDTASGQQPLRVSACHDLREAVIATTDPFILTPSEQGAWNHLRATARIARYGLDAYGYARLAGGTIDLVAESGLKSWDIAALVPVVRGAGGLVTDWRGNAPKLRGQIVCASSQPVLDQALLALRRAAD